MDWSQSIQILELMRIPFAASFLTVTSAFSLLTYVVVVVQSLCHVQLFATPWVIPVEVAAETWCALLMNRIT